MAVSCSLSGSNFCRELVVTWGSVPLHFHDDSPILCDSLCSAVCWSIGGVFRFKQSCFMLGSVYCPRTPGGGGQSKLKRPCMTVQRPSWLCLCICTDAQIWDLRQKDTLYTIAAHANLVSGVKYEVCLPHALSSPPRSPCTSYTSILPSIRNQGPLSVAATAGKCLPLVWGHSMWLRTMAVI